MQAESESRVKALDKELWEFDAEKFLPHGTRADDAPQCQPIYLTALSDNPNGADVRFFLGGVLGCLAIGFPQNLGDERTKTG